MPALALVPTPEPRGPDAFEALTQSWLRHHRAANRSKQTLTLYRYALGAWHTFLVDTGRPTDPAQLTRADLEAWLLTLRDQERKPKTLRTYFVVAKGWVRWLVAEEEIPKDITLRMPEPEVPEQPPAVLGAGALKRLLATCNGPTFQERRDLAILTLLLDTGMRRGECVGLEVDDLHLDAKPARVAIRHTKGGRARWGALGARTVKALDRYLRLRARHPHAGTVPALWLGLTGAITGRRLYQIVATRAAEAGLTGVHPHTLRHTFAHEWLKAGGQEGDLMKLAGWQSSAMLRKYGASAAMERALDHHAAFSPADRLT